jgi:hypothetical protein
MTEPLDDLDREILARIARDDPPPPDLDDRVLFVLGLAGLEDDLARLADEELVTARAGEQARTITFDADSRTVLITVRDRPDHLVRIDGWLAPGAVLVVELRFPEPEEPRRTTADEMGRFVLDEVPHGLAQLIVHPPGPGTPRVVTPSLLL